MNNELKKAYTVAAAGLFHDIGKLLQRVGMQLKTLGYDLHYLKNNQYAHAAYTAMFFSGTAGGRDYDQVFQRFKELDENDKSAASLTNLAAMHHKPENQFQWIIAEADRLASGFERAKGEDGEYERYVDALKKHEQELGEKATFKSTLLRNIFSEIFTKEGKASDSFYSLEPINPNITPIEKTVIPANNAGEGYFNLVEGLLNDLTEIASNISEYSLDNLYMALCSVLEKYCWCIPAATVSFNRAEKKFEQIPSTVSLYDHMRSTSAIATALYTYHSSKNTLNETNIKNKEINKFCFIQGDFSGIQDFIFDAGGESNKFAAKILRAKSFFVSMATEAAAYALCDEMNIPYSSIVFNAGGKFTIIAGNTKEVREAVKKIRQEVNNGFHKRTFGQTRFNIVGVPFSPNELTGDKFGNLMERLTIELEKQKLRPVIDNYVFESYLEERNENNTCSICGKHWGDKEVHETKMCGYCEQFQKIGERLVKAEYVQLNKSDGYPLFGSWNFDFKKDDFSQLTFDIVSDDKFRGLAKKRISNYVPRNGDKLKEFEQLAEAAIRNDSRGTKNLAILKADVDNLGQIFIKGLQNNSISKTATLSRMLDYFFTGWLQNELKGKDIYTVFSGGDDLFLIGAWNQIVELSGKIAEHLKAYSGGNPDVHLSAGVILRKPSIPVREMAEDAKEALAEAKSGGRNRITALMQTVTWEDYMKLDNFKKRLEEVDAKSELSTSYLYGLLKFSEDAEEAEKVQDEISKKWLNAAKWRALLKYKNYRNVFAKIKDREKIEEKVKEYDFIVNAISEHKLALKIPLSFVVYERRRK